MNTITIYNNILFCIFIVGTHRRLRKVSIKAKQELSLLNSIHQKFLRIASMRNIIFCAFLSIVIVQHVLSQVRDETKSEQQIALLRQRRQSYFAPSFFWKEKEKAKLRELKYEQRYLERRRRQRVLHRPDFVLLNSLYGL